MPKFVFLWTDLVLWLLVAAAIGYGVHARRTPSLRVTWRHVARSAPAMAAAVVLAVFIVVALLDSVHFRPRLGGAGGCTAGRSAAAAGRGGRKNAQAGRRTAP